MSIKGLDAQMRLEPLEEQFHRLAELVEQANGERGQIEVVGEEPEKTLLLSIVETDEADRVAAVLA